MNGELRWTMSSSIGTSVHRFHAGIFVSQFLRLLKQPDLAEMVMATKRRHDAEAAAGGAAASAAGDDAAEDAGAGGAAAASSHAFWDTQPVPKLSESFA